MFLSSWDSNQAWPNLQQNWLMKTSQDMSCTMSLTQIWFLWGAALLGCGRNFGVQSTILSRSSALPWDCCRHCHKSPHLLKDTLLTGYINPSLYLLRISLFLTRKDKFGASTESKLQKRNLAARYLKTPHQLFAGCLAEG